MSLMEPVPLGDVHSELSCILYAVQTGLKDIGVTVELKYDQYRYLTVDVEIWGSTLEKIQRKTETVVARLLHGILHDEYDYRFTMISRMPDEFLKDYESSHVKARVDLHHWPHRRPHGWIPPVKPSECSSSSVGAAPRPAPRAANGRAA